VRNFVTTKKNTQKKKENVSVKISREKEPEARDREVSHGQAVDREQTRGLASPEGMDD
jgi:hypothetical protein